MGAALALAGFWGHAAVGFLYAALAIWVFHQFGTRNRQQLSLIAALALTAFWGVATVLAGPYSQWASFGETARNLGWLGFLFALLKSGESHKHPQTISMLYGALLLVLMMQPLVDAAILAFAPSSAAAARLRRSRQCNCCA